MNSASVAVVPSVLVVDDEPVLSGTVKNYLERAGMSAQTCGDGLAALDLVRATAPDVVVLDLGLPGMDGVEVCRQLRTFSDCYVLMLTARADEVDKLIGLSVGADDYMTKPFSPRELVARIQVLLRRPRAGSTGATAAVVHRIGALTIHIQAAKRQTRIHSIQLRQTILIVSSKRVTLRTVLMTAHRLILTHSSQLLSRLLTELIQASIHASNILTLRSHLLSKQLLSRRRISRLLG